MELSVRESDRLLVVAPHPDDETIGAGGVIIRWPAQTEVLVLTDGRLGHGDNMTDDECAGVRSAELSHAMQEAGAAKWTQLGIRDHQVGNSYAKVAEFDFTPYTYIFVPNRHESHIDHRAANTAVRRAVKKQKAEAKIIEYEVWTPIPYPDLRLDVTDLMEKKRQMIRCYASQMEEFDYEKIMAGLSAYRGAMMNTGYAEMFSTASARTRGKEWLRFCCPGLAQRIEQRHS